MNYFILKSLLTTFAILSPVVVFSEDPANFVESLGAETDPTFAQKYELKTNPEEMVEYMMNHTLPEQAAMYNFLTQVARIFRRDVEEYQYIRNIEYALQRRINVFLKEVGYQKSISFRLFYYQINYYIRHKKFPNKELAVFVKFLDKMHGGELQQNGSTGRVPKSQN